jgi:hypothetical protein
MMFNDDHDCRHAKCLNPRHLHDDRLAIIGIHARMPVIAKLSTNYEDNDKNNATLQASLGLVSFVQSQSFARSQLTSSLYRKKFVIVVMHKEFETEECTLYT